MEFDPISTFEGLGAFLIDTELFTRQYLLAHEAFMYMLLGALTGILALWAVGAPLYICKAYPSNKPTRHQQTAGIPINAWPYRDVAFPQPPTVNMDELARRRQKLQEALNAPTDGYTTIGEPTEDFEEIDAELVEPADQPTANTPIADPTIDIKPVEDLRPRHRRPRRKFLIGRRRAA